MTGSPFQIPVPRKEGPPQPWTTPRSWVSIALTAAIVLSFGISLLTLEWSNVVSASGVVMGLLLMLVGALVGLLLLAVELKERHRRAALWPALLLCASGVPLLLIFLVSFAIDF